MEDLKTLISRIEEKRQQKEVWRFVGASAAAVSALVLIFIFAPRPEAPAPVVVVPEKPAYDPYHAVDLFATAAIVYDLTTGEMLYEKNADAQLPLASLTKLLTVYAGASALGTGSVVSVSAQALMPEGDSGFYVGESFAFSELAKAALVASSNDAAEAIAEGARTKRALSTDTLLASAATAVGLTSTYAVNGTGLDINETLSGGYGSAHDVALLAGAFLDRARPIAAATTKPSVSVTSLSGETYLFKNTNPLAPSIPGLLLSKTGYTDLAGGNLAIIFDASLNHPIAVVVLGSTVDGRFSDVSSLVRATLDSFLSPL